MDHYSHLKFYSNTERERNHQLGGKDILPSLNRSVQENVNDQINPKSTTEKHADILEYLKLVPKNSRVTFIDISKGKTYF